MHPERSNVLGDDPRAASKRPARVQTHERGDAVVRTTVEGIDADARVGARVGTRAGTDTRVEGARDDARRRERGFVPRRGNDRHAPLARLRMYGRLGEEDLRGGAGVGVGARLEDDERASRGATLHGNDATRRAGKRHLVRHRARPMIGLVVSKQRREAQPRVVRAGVFDAHHREMFVDARDVSLDVSLARRAVPLDDVRLDVHVRAVLVVVVGERLRRLFPLGASRRRRDGESTVGEKRDDAFAPRRRPAGGSRPRQFHRGRRESNLRRAHRRGKLRATQRRDERRRAVDDRDGARGGNRRVASERVFLH